MRKSEARDYDRTDRLLTAADGALRALLAPARAARPTPLPAPGTASAELSPEERREAAGLMRVNHAGEVAAQALYHGQALAARNPRVRQELLAAGREETDHLAWTQGRLAELEARRSLLDPLWYAGSFAMGAAAGSLPTARLASERMTRQIPSQARGVDMKPPANA